MQNIIHIKEFVTLSLFFLIDINMYIITNNVLVSYEPDDDSRKFQFFPKLRSGRQRQLPLLAHQFNN